MHLLNLGILRDAIDGDPEFLARLGDNVRALQKDGLIRVARADTFSGQSTYLAQIECGAFDVLNVNFNPADDAARDAVFAAAKKAGMSIVVREAYIKGEWFRLGHEAGVADEETLARAAMKWVFAQANVGAVIVGAGTPAQLRCAAAALADPVSTDAERDALARVLQSDGFRTLAARKRAEFLPPDWR